MTYEEIEDLLFSSETNDLVLDGDYYTDPFFALVNQKVGDMFLFYTLDGDYALIYGYVIIDPKSQSIIKFNKNVDKGIRMSENLGNYDLYKRLFEQLHEFVFSNDLTITQLNILKDFYRLLHSAEMSFTLEIYNSFAPEFLTWVKQQLS